METSAVLLEGAKQLSIQSVGLKEPADGDVVVQVIILEFQPVLKVCYGLVPCRHFQVWAIL